MRVEAGDDVNKQINIMTSGNASSLYFLNPSRTTKMPYIITLH